MFSFAKPSVRLVSALLLAVCCVFGSGYAAAAEQLIIAPPRTTPAGFNFSRLQETVNLYLAELGGRLVVSVSAPPPEHRGLLLRLDWPDGAAAPLQAELFDFAERPSRRYSFQVDPVQPWEAFERLVALKLRSSVRQAFDERRAGLTPEPLEAKRWSFALSGYADATDQEPHPLVGAGFAIGTGGARWQFLLDGYATLSHQSAERTHMLWGGRGSVRFNQPLGSQFLVQLDAGAGIRVSEVSSRYQAVTRQVQLVSPTLFSAIGLGFKIAPDWVLSVGPHADWILSRAQVSNAASVVFDTGRVAIALELAIQARF